MPTIADLELFKAAYKTVKLRSLSSRAAYRSLPRGGCMDGLS